MYCVTSALGAYCRLPNSSCMDGYSVHMMQPDVKIKPTSSWLSHSTKNPEHRAIGLPSVNECIISKKKRET